MILGASFQYSSFIIIFNHLKCLVQIQQGFICNSSYRFYIILVLYISYIIPSSTIVHGLEAISSRIGVPRRFFSPRVTIYDDVPGPLRGKRLAF